MSKKLSDLNIKVEESLKHQIEGIAGDQEHTVSEVVRMALRVYLYLVKTKRLLTVTNWILETAISGD